jgi:hypothetical protein
VSNSEWFPNAQGDSGEKVNVFGGDIIGYCEKVQVHINMCLIPNDYRIYRVIQEKVNVFGGDIIGHCEKVQVHINMCLIPNDYRIYRVIQEKSKYFWR